MAPRARSPTLCTTIGQQVHTPSPWPRTTNWNCPDTFRLADAVTGISAGDIRFRTPSRPATPVLRMAYTIRGTMTTISSSPSIKAWWTLQVFDRWGELVFETFDVKHGWDAAITGPAREAGRHAWKTYARFSSGDETTLTGDVTLLR